MNSKQSVYDVLTLGETMARLTPADFQRFGQSRAVEMHVGGSESNTAVGLARLGHRVCWLSRMTANPVGRWIAAEIAAQGVDVSHVLWTDQDRVGTYYMERGRPPRDSQVFYDRAGSAMSRMQASELPTELFTRAAAEIFHVSGITLGISPTARQTVTRAVEMAKRGGQQLSFDLNYRARLWSPEEAYAICAPIMAQADWIFLPIRDAIGVCGMAKAAAPQEICGELHSRWPQATIVLTRGNQGATSIGQTGDLIEQTAFRAEEVERLGGGDAFSAGYLSALLSGLDPHLSLRWACAAAAIKYTIPGDLPLLDRCVVESLVGDPMRGSAGIHR